MNKAGFNKILLLFIALCPGLFMGTRSAVADSVRADVNATYVPGFTRYCFQITNDDQNEPDPQHHAEHIASVTIKFISKDATAADHRFRNNVTGPKLWDSKVTIHDKDQQVVWTYGGYFGAGSKTKFTVDKTDETIQPGNRSSIFSFIVNGEITVTEIETGYQESPGFFRSHCKISNPFGEGLLTNDNDKDFLRDKDGNGIADIFDDNPDSTE
ncbi:MAG: hypothetical protein AABY49_12370 [Planctomycetota bacterium]